MKKIIILLACIALGLQVNAQDNGTSLYWQVKIYDPSQMGAHYPRSPVQPPTASMDGYTFSVSGAHPDYWVRIVNIDDEDDVVYETPMTAGTSSIELPSALSGDYQIQLIWDNWMFYGWITL
jgi:hypothetical protein